MSHTTGDIDAHEFAVDAKEELIFVNTKYSCLATLDPVHSFKPLWKPPFISRLAPEDGCHLNGLAMPQWRAKIRDRGVALRRRGWLARAAA